MPRSEHICSAINHHHDNLLALRFWKAFYKSMEMSDQISSGIDNDCKSPEEAIVLALFIWHVSHSATNLQTSLLIFF